MTTPSEIPEFETMLEQRRAEKAETIRFAKHGLFIHDGALVRADQVDAILHPAPVPEKPDAHLEYCRRIHGAKKAQVTI